MKLTTSANCPVCNRQMQFNWETQEIPYFGEAMVIAGVCTCGFRHSDTILLGQKEPARFTLQVTDPDDMDARVIRSSSGTIRVPELGVDVEPGHASESYVSNVEGVLSRIEDVVDFATRSARDAGSVENTRRGEMILENIALARQGRFKLTVILEDPLGNSAIVSDKAVRSVLSTEEIECLKTGMLILDV
ncbi:MAG: ZPR1 zinc-finger domain protein [Methanosaeta sp. PtaB.Bin018]|nr:ZPR1 zinc finger domain-containing protein [Methanothrix sp.]OPX74796.1 MAG: ZPR1 zinc-finger domain protein [Methanosaeta sp. PtaB.Bin018]OPY47983.1 MAG: ZPR1 zinc-finger domain protein [Methanosaeta sp. PtaU1.Bin016]